MKAKAKAKASQASQIGQIRADAKKTGNASWLETRSKLLGAAAEAIKEKGLEAVTMNDIAIRFESDRATIYYYFSSKHEIYTALVEKTLKPLVEASEKIGASNQSAMARLRQIIEMFMEGNERHWPYIYLYTQEDMRRLPPNAPRAKELKEIGDRSVNNLRRIVRDGKRSGEFRQDLDEELIVYAVHGATQWTHRWFTPGGRLSGKQVGSSFMDIFQNGIVAGASSRPRRS